MGMMPIDADLPADWQRLPIQSVSACKLYYVKDGRNAWHSTWVTRWYPDSFHMDAMGARVWAETQRVQGSVFYIVELPALLMAVSRGYALATELNVDKPLAGYQPLDSIAKMEKRSARWYDPRTAPPHIARQWRRTSMAFHPVVGRRLGGVLDSFRTSSLAWDASSSRRVVVRIICGDQATTVQPCTPGESLRCWKSSSDGSQYSLAWLEQSRVLNAEGVSAIVVRSKALRRGGDSDRRKERPA